MEGGELAEGEKNENVVFEFRLIPAHDMRDAFLLSRWTSPGRARLALIFGHYGHASARNCGRRT